MKLFRWSSPETIASDLDLVQAKTVVPHEDRIDNVLAAAKLVGLPLSNVSVFGDRSIKGARTVDDTILKEEELAAPYEYTPEQIMKDPAYLYFTSGTTGRKKVVIMTQRVLMTCMLLTDNWDFADFNILAYIEFHHASLLVTIMHIAVYYGRTAYIMAHYNFRGLCKAIEKYKINFAATQPYIVAVLAKDSIAHEYDLSSLKLFVCCGAALDKSITAVATDRLGLKIINA